MEDNIMEVTNENEEVNEELNLVEEETETTGIAGVAVIGTIIAGTAIGLVVKNREKIARKIDERRIKKLQKKGYEVYASEEVETVEVEVVEDEELAK